MKYITRILILTFVMLTLVSMAGVCASDVNDTAITSDNTNQVIEETDIDDNLAIGEDEVIVQTNNNEIISEKDSGTFTALQKKIDNADNGSTITLENDYVYNGFGGPIKISKTLTIEGKGFTIDGTNDTPLFYVTASNVVFKDIVFVNGKSYAKGGALNGKCTAINCTFNSNSANYGGAMNGGYAVDCTFNSNSATYSGGAIYEGHAVNCNFIKNTAKNCGGAMIGSSAVNCVFTNNRASSDGGAMYEGNAKNCEFRKNSATYHGGATDFTTATNCIFIGNYAGSSGGAMCEGTAIDCIFKDNAARFSGDDTSGTDIINTNKEPGKGPKLTPKLIAKKKTFKVKTKIKKYTAILKTNKNKAMKKVKLYLKVKGKTYTAKTNNNGKAIFKIKNLKKKGTFKAKITFKGNKNYEKVTKTVKIKVK